MKKILTVLLALSVVFTYTVGTAFAASGATLKSQAEPTYTLAEVETAIYAQAQKNVEMLNTVKANFLANYDANKVTVEEMILSKAAVEKEIGSIFNDIAAAINKVADDQKADAVKVSNVTETTYKQYTGDYKDSLFIDEQGTKASKENSFDATTYENAEALETAMESGPVYTEELVKVDGKGEWTSSTQQFYVKKEGITWYEIDQEAFPGFFEKAEKEAYEAAINNEYLKYDTAAEVQKFIHDNAAKYSKTLLTAEHAIQKAGFVVV